MLTVEMNDTFGDGWNGNDLTIEANSEDGVDLEFTIQTGDSGLAHLE